MEINKPAKAGTMESNDIYVMIMPNPKGGIEINLQSIVMKQFGEEIEKVILDTLVELEVKNIIVSAQDKGALNYTIKARIETATKRAQ
ncbi:citrate lyase acyl carrier protein [Clostridium tagluense]|uniref:citrate lyase acyl carrier protein n=1 Tax=Clostridium TaxID=1485 RepID=UPI0013E9048F|nr:MULTISPECIES: citrate lyase acyl carrier protein [Clostridium]MBU3128528.1 citrate lyase acyl carrier protein [Clostridium tagluense]MBW9157545.1 citrate lyase acyl carrier protein [Clostridium tagluense]MBZ9625647.1 citrate lyase acyl carrier protein [Clostridium sp. FP2]MBZ9637060.1 citrate lyase acyl carrier protein [Clostridium sp. FP1]MCB2298122.1 citrate lyase acyl carrier protein [Clostridium tagluense]